MYKIPTDGALQIYCDLSSMYEMPQKFPQSSTKNVRFKQFLLIGMVFVLFIYTFIKWARDQRSSGSDSTFMPNCATECANNFLPILPDVFPYLNACRFAEFFRANISALMGITQLIMTISRIVFSRCATNLIDVVQRYST